MKKKWQPRCTRSYPDSRWWPTIPRIRRCTNNSDFPQCCFKFFNSNFEFRIIRLVNYKSCKRKRGNCVEFEPACGVIAAIFNAVEVDVICIAFVDVLTSAICQQNTSILWFKSIYALLQIVHWPKILRCNLFDKYHAILRGNKLFGTKCLKSTTVKSFREHLGWARPVLQKRPEEQSSSSRQPTSLAPHTWDITLLCISEIWIRDIIITNSRW